MLKNVTDETLSRDGFSVEEVAARYGISEGLVRLEIARKRLRSVHLGRRVIIPKRAIEEWLSAATR